MRVNFRNVYVHYEYSRARVHTCTRDSRKHTCVHILVLETRTRDRARERRGARQVIAWDTPPLMQTLHACIMQRIRRNKAHHQFHTSRESSIIGHLSIETRTRVIHLWRKGISVQHIVERLAEEDISIIFAECVVQVVE